MFGPPGRAYVYLVYGMYDCLNIVTEADGEPAALLVRALEPLEGEDLMRSARLAATLAGRRVPMADRATAEAARIARIPNHRLASGPGLAAAAFGLTRAWTGRDLCDPSSPLRLESPPPGEAEPRIRTTPRIGVDYAGPEWAGRPWRFVIAGHRSASGPASAR